MKTLALVIFIAIWIALPEVATAENWVAVSPTPEAKNVGIRYLDKDSVSRKGDLATVKAKTWRGMESITFDCVRNLFYFNDWLETLQPVKNADYIAAATIACKQPWEIWK